MSNSAVKSSPTMQATVAGVPGSNPHAQAVEVRNQARTALYIEAFMQLRRTMAQCLLFPPGTPQFEKTCNASCAALNAVLNETPRFSMRISDLKVFANGEMLEISPALQGHIQHVEKLMRAAGTITLIFEHGLTNQELGAFLHLLTKRKLTSSDGKKTNFELHEQGITHVSVEEIQYVAVGAAQKIVPLDAPVLSQNSAGQQGVGQVLGNFEHLIESTNDSSAKDQLRAELAGQLLDRDPEILKCSLAAVAQRTSMATAGEFQALFAEGPREHLLLADITALVKDLNMHNLPEDDQAWETLRKLIERLVAPYQGHSEDLLSKAPIDPVLHKLLPQWLYNAEMALRSGEAQERVAGLLTQSPLSLLDEDMFAVIVDVFDELSVARMDAEAEQLTAHAAGALKALTKEERMTAVTRLSFLLQRCMEQNSQAIKLVEDALLDACTHETCDEVMKLLLQHLSDRTVLHFGNDNYERALEHMQWIASLEESSRLALREEGANLAGQARAALGSSEFTATLAAALPEGGEKAQAASRLGHLLGINVWSKLIDAIKSEPDHERLAVLVAQLREGGPEAVKAFLASMAQALDGAAASRLLAVAAGLEAGADLWPHVAPLLIHDEASVRHAALNFCRERDSEPAASALAGALQIEADFARRESLAVALGCMKNPAAAQLLLDALESAASSQNDNAYILPLFEALSNCEDARIVVPLCKWVQNAGVLLPSKTPGSSKAITLAAMRALARFYQDPLAADVFEHARRDKDQEISRYAVVCMRGIVAANQKQAEQSTPPPAEPLAPQPTPLPARKVRRGFEELEKRDRVEEIFLPGAAIGGAAQAKPSARSPVPVLEGATQEAGEFLTRENKPILQGNLESIGLSAAMRIVGGKNGVLMIKGPEGPGYLFIHQRRIIAASYPNASDMEALSAIDAIKAAPFAFYQKEYTRAPSMTLEITELDRVIRELRDKRDESLYR